VSLDRPQLSLQLRFPIQNRCWTITSTEWASYWTVSWHLQHWSLPNQKHRATSNAI